jgi:hypothetical protein
MHRIAPILELSTEDGSGSLPSSEVLLLGN